MVAIRWWWMTTRSCGYPRKLIVYRVVLHQQDLLVLRLVYNLTLYLFVLWSLCNYTNDALKFSIKFFLLIHPQSRGNKTNSPLGMNDFCSNTTSLVHGSTTVMLMAIGEQNYGIQLLLKTRGVQFGEGFMWPGSFWMVKPVSLLKWVRLLTDRFIKIISELGVDF